MHVGGQPLQLGVQVVERHLQLVDVALDLTKLEIHLLQPIQQPEVHHVEPLLDPVEADAHLVAEIDQLLADLLELFEDHRGRRLGLTEQTREGDDRGQHCDVEADARAEHDLVEGDVVELLDRLADVDRGIDELLGPLDHLDQGRRVLVDASGQIVLAEQLGRGGQTPPTHP